MIRFSPRRSARSIAVVAAAATLAPVAAVAAATAATATVSPTSTTYLGAGVSSAKTAVDQHGALWGVESVGGVLRGGVKNLATGAYLPVVPKTTVVAGIGFDARGYAYVLTCGASLAGKGEIDVYAPDATAGAAPARTIKGSATGMDTAGFCAASGRGIAVSPSGSVIVAGGTLTKAFLAFSTTASGNVKPSRSYELVRNCGVAFPGKWMATREHLLCVQ